MDASTQSHWTPDAMAPATGGLGWEEAQAAVNFVLFRPDPLPEGISVESASVRPEAPPANDLRLGWTLGNRATHRCELAAGGARLRIRQLLYDWAPPAWDHPSLTGDVTPFVVGGHIGWLGRDFRGLDAATVTLDRTTIDVSVREGHCPPALLVALLQGLRPVSADARARILSTPFGRLAYGSRHRDRTPSVPVGFWHHRRGPPNTHVRVHDYPPPGLPGAHIAPPARLGFRIDTVQVFGGGADPLEVEYLHVDEADPGRTIRILVSPSAGPGGVRFPPVPEGQPCTVEQGDVHCAHGDPRYGPHEAVWQRDGLNVMLLAKPAPWTDRYWFARLLSDVSFSDC
jgi:hypothetical protein